VSGSRSADVIGTKANGWLLRRVPGILEACESAAVHHGRIQPKEIHGS
jgi:hypothetical protein